MALRAFALLLAASPLIIAAHGAGQGSLEERQTCSTCILGGNPITKLVELIFFGDGQTTDDCRYGRTFGKHYTLANSLSSPRLESAFGLPTDLGGTGKGDIQAAVRINFEEDRVACSVEGLSIPTDGGENRCVAGGCSISEITDESAVVTWGACIIRPDITVVDNQPLTDAECIPAQGVIKFARFHDTRSCSGSDIVSEVTVAGRSTSEFSPNDSGGLFVGGVVTVCSTV